ncbi:MAG: hypothetical protein H7293_20075 [Candidatus Saccharibacteria bacterium]|nr:hypothetical protein [Rhodoferax sp.]
MLVYPAGQSDPIRGDLIIRTVLRSDLTPIPQTVELQFRESAETLALKEGSVMRVGRQGAEFLIVKNSPGGDTGLVAGNQSIRGRAVVGLLASCAPIAQRTQRAIYRRGASLGEIYRACGAQVRIESEFTIDTFCCLKGMTPSFEVAKALQEEAGVLVYVDSRVAFRRLSELLKTTAVVTLNEDSTESVHSEFLEQHHVPFAFSTGVDGGFLSGRAEGGHGVMYRPRADVRILNNLGTALIMRRKLQSDFAPHVLAGMRVDIASKPMVVITAAHCEDGGADGGAGQQYTRLWLGELVK